jgi:hypothetical protein
LRLHFFFFQEQRAFTKQIQQLYNYHNEFLPAVDITCGCVAWIRGVDGGLTPLLQIHAILINDDSAVRNPNRYVE